MPEVQREIQNLIVLLFLVPGQLQVRQSLKDMAKIFPFSSLAAADLVIDAIYEGGTDPLGKLIPGAGKPQNCVCEVFTQVRPPPVGGR
jgi:hypothetical protein